MMMSQLLKWVLVLTVWHEGSISTSAFLTSKANTRKKYSMKHPLVPTGPSVSSILRPCPKDSVAMMPPLSSTFIATDNPAPSLLEELFYNPVSWSVTVISFLVALLLLWDFVLEFAREKTPVALRPIIEKMLAELGSLGFIGIMVGILLQNHGPHEALEALSEKYLGDHELLTESFEFFHQAFFQVAVLYFVVSATLIYRVTQTLTQVTTVAERTMGPPSAANRADGLPVDVSGTACGPLDLSRLALVYPVYEIPADMAQRNNTEEQIKWIAQQRQEDNPSRLLFDEFTLSMETRGAQALVIRERLIEELDGLLTPDFRFAPYLEQEFAKENLEIVELSPAAWIPLIPTLALADSLDLAHDVVNADSSNALASSGFFVSTPWVIGPFVVLQMICFAWGITNFWKMAYIKRLILPNIVQDAAVAATAGRDDGGNEASATSPLRILQPRVESEALRAEFCSTPPVLKPIEAVFRKEPNCINDQIFGEIGANGPKVYLNSIKFSTWLSVVGLFFFSWQILRRDVAALLLVLSGDDASAAIGNLDGLIPEIVVYGSFAIANAFQVVFLAPTTLLNLCLATSVGNLKEQWASKMGLSGWDGTPESRPP